MENSHLGKNLTKCNFCYVFNSTHSITNHRIIKHLTNLCVRQTGDCGRWPLTVLVATGHAPVTPSTLNSQSLAKQSGRR